MKIKQEKYQCQLDDMASNPIIDTRILIKAAAYLCNERNLVYLLFNLDPQLFKASKIKTLKEERRDTTHTPHFSYHKPTRAKKNKPSSISIYHTPSVKRTHPKSHPSEC